MKKVKNIENITEGKVTLSKPQYQLYLQEEILWTLT